MAASHPSVQPDFYSHPDLLAVLDGVEPLERKLEAVHAHAAAGFSSLARVAVAAYDAATDRLRTLMASDHTGRRLAFYEARLAESVSLRAVLEADRPRVVNDLDELRGSGHEHTRWIRNGGFRSSYTLPIRHEGVFLGFVFFNALTQGAFTPERLERVDAYAHLVAALVAAEMRAHHVLAAAVKTALDLVHVRDPETGAHMDRMAHYTRLIARRLGRDGGHGIRDLDVERLFRFAPLHDLGKIGLPDRLLKGAHGLSPAERAEMQTHTTAGRDMVDAMGRNFGLEKLPGLALLREIAWHHHEALDGSGYPQGLRDGQIPLAARIVAVADVFDALSSARTYKPAWSDADAFAALRRLAGSKLDADCVAALIAEEDSIRDIQARFAEGPSPEAPPEA